MKVELTSDELTEVILALQAHARDLEKTNSKVLSEVAEKLRAIVEKLKKAQP